MNRKSRLFGADIDALFGTPIAYLGEKSRHERAVQSVVTRVLAFGLFKPHFARRVLELAVDLHPFANTHEGEKILFAGTPKTRPSLSIGLLVSYALALVHVYEQLLPRV